MATILGAGEQLTINRPQWPLKTFDVRTFGAYLAKRTSEKEGACGTQSYPCVHRGVDLSAPEGAPVFVPFTGWVLYYGPADKPPFEGYGPYVALIAHADRETPLLQRVKEWATGPLIDIADIPEGAVSVRYSLIAHLAAPLEHPGEVSFLPLPLPGAHVKPQPLVSDIWDAAKPKPNADHWRPQKAQPQNVVMYTDAEGYTPARIVYAGQQLGTVSNKNHVHWELRTAPIQPANPKGKAWRIDPIATFNQAYQVPLPEGLRPPPIRGEEAAEPRGGGGLVILGLAALALGKRKKKRARRR